MTATEFESLKFQILHLFQAMRFLTLTINTKIAFTTVDYYSLKANWERTLKLSEDHIQKEKKIEKHVHVISEI